jgi:hypothetical protein
LAAQPGRPRPRIEVRPVADGDGLRRRRSDSPTSQIEPLALPDDSPMSSRPDRADNPGMEGLVQRASVDRAKQVTRRPSTPLRRRSATDAWRSRVGSCATSTWPSTPFRRRSSRLGWGSRSGRSSTQFASIGRGPRGREGTRRRITLAYAPAPMSPWQCRRISRTDTTARMAPHRCMTISGTYGCRPSVPTYASSTSIRIRLLMRPFDS